MFDVDTFLHFSVVYYQPSQMMLKPVTSYMNYRAVNPTPLRSHTTYASAPSVEYILEPVPGKFLWLFLPKLLNFYPQPFVPNLTIIWEKMKMEPGILRHWCSALVSKHLWGQWCIFRLERDVPQFDIPESFSTIVGYVQPCFEPWTGWFSHNTHHVSSIYSKIICGGHVSSFGAIRTKIISWEAKLKKVRY